MGGCTSRKHELQWGKNASAIKKTTKLIRKKSFVSQLKKLMRMGQGVNVKSEAIP